jgi:hypothetical protein
MLGIFEHVQGQIESRKWIVLAGVIKQIVRSAKRGRDVSTIS